MSTVDPGLGESISRETKDSDADDKRTNLEPEDDEDYAAPAEWWFASTACPLLAGTFGPLANAFSICALVEKWRLRLPPGVPERDGIPIQDPGWLIAINAISLVCAFAGNSSLLLNMAKRVRFSIAQPITIAGFFLAGILLVSDMAALVAAHNYHLDSAESPKADHALSGAFYYAIFASSLYLLIAMAMCLTVYGAYKGYYKKDFSLTSAQRTLMLQTMLYVIYLLLGGLMWSHIEDWRYLDAVYWADVTLLTVGLGDFAPSTSLGRGLLFPYAILGIVMLGLVVGSIRSLVLERGQEKMAARISEKRRHSAVQNVDEHKQEIKISWFAKADFSTDPALSPGQRREEEFHIMRKVLKAAERERQWFGLAVSVLFALILWFVGAAIFMVAEQEQQWTYLDALFFSYFCLLTIGYGSPLTPQSNSGRAFFVVWSLLAVPSLTILISNMGDTIVKWFSDLTVSIGGVTILPEEHGFRNSLKAVLRHFTPPGLLGDSPQHLPYTKMSSEEHTKKIRKMLADRLGRHLDEQELEEMRQAKKGVSIEMDIQFFHYILACEIRILQQDLGSNPPKQYSWAEWEYYLKLIGDCDTDDTSDSDSEALIPRAMQQSKATSFPASPVSPHDQVDGVVDRETERWEEGAKAEKCRHKKHLKRTPRQPHRRDWKRVDIDDWSWLSNKSPLMSRKSETEWILERLSAALELDLSNRRKGLTKQPAITVANLRHSEILPLDTMG